jgi:epoxide hydrolase-like predicted phosphatase
MTVHRGLLVDYGGVLTTDVFASFEAFCAASSLPPGTVRELFRADPTARALLAGLEDGSLDASAFEAQFAALLGVSPTGLIDRLMAGANDDPAMLSFIRLARSCGVRTGLISNSWGVQRYDRGLLADLFDGVVISGEVGLRKPSPEMYSLGASSVGLPPSQCVYVDDLPGNLKPARALGMTTVHHVSAVATIDALRPLLGLST